MTHVCARGPADDLSTWERRSQMIFDYTAYVLLAVGLAIVLAQPQSAQDRVTAVLLSLVAGAWMTLFLRVPALRDERRVPMALFFVGFLAITTALMLLHPLFFPVAIGGFFFAYALRPWPVALLGVALTSVVLNTFVAEDSFPPANAQDAVIYLVIVAVQTLTIGGGVVVGQKMTELLEERRRTVARLEATLDENAGLHTQLMVQAREAGVLDERQRLAREIHDTLAQGLTGIVTQLEAATRAQGEPSAQRQRIDTAMRLARESLSDARRSVQALAPEPLANARLPEALAEVGQRWSADSGVAVDVTTTGTSQWLHPAVDVTLLRVAQEALANVARHASASRAVVTLSYMHDLVTLDVRDDGIGFTPPPPGMTNGPGRSGGFGLNAMRQRVQDLAGTLVIESERGAGTSISVSVPVEPAGLRQPSRVGGAAHV